MGKIQILPESLANQIAAGEVVERPASVVKELVENSIDASATHIKVQIDDGGKKKIRVIDDGEGMSTEDAKLAFKRHTTSKIANKDDLHKIKTMGFRGEALSSIASVAKITLRTYQPSENKPDGFREAGVMLNMEAGEITGEKPVGMPKGTDISVNDLFYNVPARQKFLKTTRTEAKHITETIINLALAHPKIGFVLENNGHRTIDVPADTTRGDALQRVSTRRVNQLLGEGFLGQTEPISLNNPHLKISGRVNKPGYGSESTKNQYLFVNRRRVDNKTVYGAVKKAFGGILGRGEYPQFLLYISISPDLIDVNVHPRKEEVRFVNEGMVFNLVRQTVGKAISSQSTVHRAQLGEVSENGWQRVENRMQNGRNRISRGLSDASPRTSYPSSFQSTLAAVSAVRKNYLEDPPLLQIDNLYLVIENPAGGGLNIYDQHAVHERILYEKFVEDFQNEQKKGESQELLMAETLSLSTNDYEMLTENLETLKKIGFDIEEFGKNTVKINAVPSVFKGRNSRSVLTEFLSSLSNLSNLEGNAEEAVTAIDLHTHRVLSTLACRSAIKAGDHLSQTQAQELLKQLSELDRDPASPSGLRRTSTCPHGRPVKTVLTEKELAKLFRRT